MLYRVDQLSVSWGISRAGKAYILCIVAAGMSPSGIRTCQQSCQLTCVVIMSAVALDQALSHRQTCMSTSVTVVVH